MNKSGQTFFLTIMISLVFIIAGLAFAPAIIEFSTQARSPTSATQVGLDCDNASISNFDKANCLFVDYMAPLFVGLLIFLAGVIIKARVVA